MAPARLKFKDPSDEQRTILLHNLRLQQHGSGGNVLPVPPISNPCDEPRPLGLQLKRSSSFLTSLPPITNSMVEAQAKKVQKVTATMDKPKPLNYSATLLKIGSWEYKAIHEGDLAVKCYFRKSMFVWEILNGGLKNKIEIKWSDITALKATYADEVGTLNVVLAKQPIFFREINQEPRKRTLWQCTIDFTGGEATIHRQHCLQFPRGLLEKSIRKLKSDIYLNSLIEGDEIFLQSPYFEPHTIHGSATLDLREATSPLRTQELVGEHPKHFPPETPSPSSVIQRTLIGENDIIGIEELMDLSYHISDAGIHPSIPMSDLESHIATQFSEQKITENRERLEILYDISRCLLTDSEPVSISDEQFLARVDSLNRLIQNSHELDSVASDVRPDEVSATLVGESTEQELGLPRKDSIGELLYNLPRMASQPKFYHF